ncbi:RICIN domain-containing protein [Embleya sp. NPDC059213]|uniref:RICIN domain-containing protein n=1 Tax=Embleya sp. NPDC059213 TaxID=3346771 RepID=UPI0036828895
MDPASPDRRAGHPRPGRDHDHPAAADPPPSSQSIPYGLTDGKRHTIQSRFSYRCLEIRGDRIDDGAPANQWDCNPSTTQNRWARRASTGYEIANGNSGLCLEIRDDRTDDGTPANQWTCNGSETQHWQDVLSGNAGRKIRNGHSGRCLEILSWGTGDGDAAGQWGCHGGADQRWSINVRAG